MTEPERRSAYISSQLRAEAGKVVAEIAALSARQDAIARTCEQLQLHPASAELAKLTAIELDRIADVLAKIVAAWGEL